MSGVSTNNYRNAERSIIRCKALISAIHERLGFRSSVTDEEATELEDMVILLHNLNYRLKGVPNDRP